MNQQAPCIIYVHILYAIFCENYFSFYSNTFSFYYAFVITVNIEKYLIILMFIW